MAKDRLVIYVGEGTYPPSHFEASGETHSTFNACVRGQLLTRTKGFKLAPGLIQKYYFDFESKSYILKLKDNLFFHHGRKATSKDLEFSLLRGFFSKRANYFSTRFGNILGVSEITPGTKYKSGLVKGVKIIDELTLSVKLKNPNPSFFHNLNSPYYSLIPMEMLKDDYLTWKDKVVGVGKYKVVRESIKEKVTILSKGEGKNEKIIELYWGKTPPVDTDISIFPIDKFNVTQSTYPISVRLLEFSNVNPLAKYKEFRQAINLVLDRNDFLNPAFGLTPLNEVLPRHFWGRVNIDSYHSLEKAKELIKKIPKELRDKQYEAIVYCTKNLSPTQKFYISKIQERLTSLGLNISFKPIPDKFVPENIAIYAPVRLNAKIVDYVDPLVMFGSYRKNGHDGYLRAQGVDQEEYQRLYEKAAAVKSLEERIESVKELNDFTVKNAVIVPLAEEKMVYYTNPKTIESLGEQLEPMTLFLDKVIKRK